MVYFIQNKVIFSLKAYTDVNFRGSKTDRKNTNGSCQFLGRSFISWFSKKQTTISLSTTEVKYIVAGSCRTQVLWLKQTIKDYGFDFSSIPIFCDNTSIIHLSKNPILHSRRKHIEIRHHFLRVHIIKKDFDFCFCAHTRTIK